MTQQHFDDLQMTLGCCTMQRCVAKLNIKQTIYYLHYVCHVLQKLQLQLLQIACLLKTFSNLGLSENTEKHGWQTKSDKHLFCQQMTVKLTKQY